MNHTAELLLLSITPVTVSSTSCSPRMLLDIQELFMPVGSKCHQADKLTIVVLQLVYSIRLN